MINKLMTWLAVFMLLFNQVYADQFAPEPIETQVLDWISPPPIPGLQFTWVTGAEQDEGLYAIRVKLDKGTIIPPHTHPDQRLSTVLSGTLYVGFGPSFNENKLVAIKKGNAYIAPANAPHFIWAKDVEVEYQETGVGPTATRLLKPE